MYGAQTFNKYRNASAMFENDVEMYGAQTTCFRVSLKFQFENDVEMYGAQIYFSNTVRLLLRLRMM